MSSVSYNNNDAVTPTNRVLITRKGKTGLGRCAMNDIVKSRSAQRCAGTSVSQTGPWTGGPSLLARDTPSPELSCFDITTVNNKPCRTVAKDGATDPTWLAGDIECVSDIVRTVSPSSPAYGRIAASSSCVHCLLGLKITRL